MANALKYDYRPEEAIDLLYQRGLLADNQTGFLQTLIDDKLNIAENTFFWQEHFMVDGNETPADLRDRKKKPTYSVIQITNPTTPMADPMAPLSETAQMDQPGFEEKTGSIYQYGKGMFETSMSKIELQARLAALGQDERNIIGGFITDTTRLIKSHNSRVSYMAAQVLSKGGEYNTTATRGMSGVTANQSAYIPASNYKKAGTKVWTASDADIPTQIQKIVEDFKTANEIPESMVFELDVPYDLMINVLLKNAEFIKQVNLYLSTTDAGSKILIVKPDGTTDYNQGIITMDQLIAYSRWGQSKVPPIRVVRQKSTTQNITTYSSVSGWEAGKVVLRPIGYAGLIVHATPSDIAMYNSGEVNNGIQMNIGKIQNFMYVINKISPNGMFKSYHTDIIGCYAPILNESNYHVIIDTTTADS